MEAYKVLDVREKESSYSYTDRTNTYTATHTVFTVIAEDVTGKRERFHMYDGYKNWFLDDWTYCGYRGSYHYLIKGDWFEIEQTNTWPIVTIIGVDNDT